eukprot:1147737-Pelagomonas_calceolata.AAC.4
MLAENSFCPTIPAGASSYLSKQVPGFPLPARCLQLLFPPTVHVDLPRAFSQQLLRASNLLTQLEEPERAEEQLAAAAELHALRPDPQRSKLMDMARIMLSSI